LENHWLIDTTPAGAPKLWNQPLIPHSTAESATVVEKPIPILAIAEISTLKAKNRFMLAWSARKPLVSLPNA
jgi:hypothetical protein